MISEETIKLLRDHVDYQQGRVLAWSVFNGPMASGIKETITDLEQLIEVARLLNSDPRLRDALAEARDRAAGADAEDEPAPIDGDRGTCAPCCGQPIVYIDSPYGGWWAHEVHPADDHDATPPDAQDAEAAEVEIS